MGSIPSVSLPSGVTCVKDCGCLQKCYAKKIEKLRKTVRESYITNYNLLKTKPDIYWREVEAAVMLTAFFRFHVSGDIVDTDYLSHMVEIAKRNPHCQLLCFTKKYDIVNKWIDNNGEIPQNLHIIFSVWRDFYCNNKYNLPEAHVRYKDGTTTAKDNCKECSGNCTDCARIDGGCWNLKCGEQVVFNEH